MTQTLTKAIEKMNGFVSVAKFYDAKFTLEDCADGQFLTVYTKDHHGDDRKKLEVAVWNNPETNRVTVKAQWLTMSIRTANIRVKNSEIEDHIEIAATEIAAHWN